MNRPKTLVAAIGVLLLAIAALVVAIPADEKLGELLKLVLFHGATTWANLVTFTVAAVLGLAFLATGRAGLWRWESGFRLVSAPLWAYNTVMGVVSMYLSWGGFLWSEPRMRMTILILLASLGVLAMHLVFERPKLTAALDVAMGVFLWTSLGLTPKVFHPNNPVMNSGTQIVALFAGLVLASTLAAVLGSALVAGRNKAPVEA